MICFCVVHRFDLFDDVTLVLVENVDKLVDVAVPPVAPKVVQVMLPSRLELHQVSWARVDALCLIAGGARAEIRRAPIVLPRRRYGVNSLILATGRLPIEHF